MVRGNAGLFAAVAMLVVSGGAKAADYVDPQWPNIPGDPGYVVGKSGTPQWPALPKQREVPFFTGEFATFNKEAANLLLETGVIRQIPDLSKLADTRFVR